MKKLLSLIMTICMLMTIVSVFPTSASAATNILYKKTYKHNGTNWFKDYTPADTSSTYLTDGKTGGTWNDGGNYFGVTHQNVYIEFDLSGVTLKEIVLNVYNNYNAGIHLPENIEIYYKPYANSAWEELYIGDFPDSTMAVFSLEKAVTTYGLKFDFKRTGMFVFIKEIMAYSTNSGNTVHKTISAPTNYGVNLSLNKSYTTTGWVNPSYPDTNNKELTDGKTGMTYTDAEWQYTTDGETYSGNEYDRNPLQSTVIDLGKVNSITQVKANFLRDSVDGMCLPECIKIFASVDGENWMKLGYLNNINSLVTNDVYTYGWHTNGLNGTVCDLTNNPLSKVKARYIRYDFEKYGTHNLIDEITVNGFEGVTSDAIDPTNTTKLENDSILTPSEKTGNIQDMILIYNQGKLTWDAEKLKPYVTYIDNQGNSKDTLFDSFLFLALDSLNGRVFAGNNETVTIDDWNWYLDRTFESDLPALNDAVTQAISDLQLSSDYKVNAVVMIPFPSATATNFGTVNGKTLDLTVESDANYLVKWYMDEVLSRFNTSGYEHLDFKGFYWVAETSVRIGVIKYATDYIRSLGYNSYWIPYFNANGQLWSEDIGFDAIAIQPNHFFSEISNSTYGGGGTKIIETTKGLAAYSNTAVEFEFDGRLRDTADFYNKGLDYLNAAVKLGYDGDGYYRNWYAAGTGINEIAYSSSHNVRLYYNNIYEVINGTYKVRDYVDAVNDNLLLGKTYTHNGSDWYADRSNDTNSVYLTDGIMDGSYSDGAFYGVQNKECPVIEFDLGNSPITFKELQVNALEDTSAGVHLPYVRVYYKPTKTSEWTEIYYKKMADKIEVLRFTEDVTAYGLKFEFKNYYSFVFIKEILAFKDETCIYADATLPRPFVLGDVNGDFTVDANDLTLFRKYFAGFDPTINTSGADLNSDGKITRLDLLKLYKTVG